METQQKYTTPCAVCEKPIRPGREKYVSCEELDFTHGHNCNCQLPVGSDCYRKIKKKNAHQPGDAIKAVKARGHGNNVTIYYSNGMSRTYDLEYFEYDLEELEGEQ